MAKDASKDQAPAVFPSQAALEQIPIVPVNPPAPSEPRGPVWVRAKTAGTFVQPGQSRAWFYDKDEIFEIPGLSFLRGWMIPVGGPDEPIPPPPPETTAPNQPLRINNPYSG